MMQRCDVTMHIWTRFQIRLKTSMLHLGIYFSFKIISFNFEFSFASGRVHVAECAHDVTGRGQNPGDNVGF
jgi:hypothetical protein